MTTVEEYRPLPPSAKWVWIGLATCAFLLLVNVGAGIAGGDRVAANIAGTLALAPTLTGIGGSRRQVSAVGLIAAALAFLIAKSDGVPGVVVILSCAVVAVVSAVVATVAGARQGALAQLQDRRQAARTLQAAMLTELPRPQGMALAARYLPASAGDQVGGDWYDAIIGTDGSTTLVIGDVTGHDVNAAAHMGQIRATMRAFASEGVTSPAELISRTERAMQTLRLDIIASAVVMTFPSPPRTAVDGSRGHAACAPQILWSSAGHPPPVLVVPGEDAAPGTALLLGDRGPAGAGHEPVHYSDATDLLMGIDASLPRRDHALALTRGARVVLYTDGLVERRDEALEISIARLGAVLAAEASKSLEGMLDDGLMRMLDGEHGDDVAVLAAEVGASPARRDAASPTGT